MTGRHDRLEGRNGAIWRDTVLGGLSQYEIAEKYRLSQSQVSRILATIRQEISSTPRQEWLEQEIGHVQEIRARLVSYLERPGTPVTAGKDGLVVVDPATGKTIRSFAEHAQIARTALAYTERLGKMLGLDSPTQVQVSPDIARKGEELAEAARKRQNLEQ